MGCWRGYLSGARCRLAYVPADTTATHSLASVKSRLVLPFWYRLTWVVLKKGPLYGCVKWARVTCKLTAKNRDQLLNPALGNRVWAAFFTFPHRKIARRALLSPVELTKILRQIVRYFDKSGAWNGARAAWSAAPATACRHTEYSQRTCADTVGTVPVPPCWPFPTRKRKCSFFQIKYTEAVFFVKQHSDTVMV